MENINLEEIIRSTVKEVVKEIGLEPTEIRFLYDVLKGNIALVKHHEDVVSGKIAPARKNVNDDDIAIDYMRGMSCKKIGAKWGMTEDGIRKKLIKMELFTPNRARENT
jgi:hypothetical protein